MRSRFVATAAVALIVAVGPLAACGTDEPAAGPSDSPSAPAGSTAIESSPAGSTPAPFVDDVVEIDGGRGLYVRCTGKGSPTVILEGGDEDTSDSYRFAEPTLAGVTRTCVYDRANLGRSDPDPGPRELPELVGDLEGLLEAAAVPGPYVLVGTSGGGYISAGFAFEHPEDVAGIVFVEVPSPFRNPPASIVRETRWDSPVNIENRNYLAVEKQAWAARTTIGDIPVTVITNQYSASEIAAAEFPWEARGMRSNVTGQRGWLVLSPQARQVLVHTGHAVEEADPDLVVQAVLDVVREAQR